MRRVILLFGLLFALGHDAVGQTADPILGNAKKEPKMLAFSRIIGGSGWDDVWSAATDKQGFIYISGVTGSEDFPKTSGALTSPLSCRINEFSGKNECKGATFVVKLSPDASQIIYSATINASFSPLVPWAMAAAPDGSVYLAGQVYRPEDFPATPGAYRSTCTARDWCAFLLKVTPSGSALEFATFFAGSAGDLPLQVMVDSDSRAWVTGRVQSTDYPVTADAFQPKPGFGYDDIFLSVFSPDGKLVYSTFFGGNGSDGAVGQLLSSSEILFAGSTTSSNFPVTDDAIQKVWADRDPAYPDYEDGIISVLNLATGLRYSTYLGGSSVEYLQGAVSAPNGAFFYTGYTNSPDFPGIPPQGATSTPPSVVTGFLDLARARIQARTYPGFYSARIMSTNESFAFVEFRPMSIAADGRIVTSSLSTIGKVSLADNAMVAAYQLPEFTPEVSGYAFAPGMLIVADHKYINSGQPNESTDIRVRGFRYAERAFAWEVPPAEGWRLQRGQVLTIPVTLRDVGSGVPAAVKIRCDQVPEDLECSVTPTEVQLEEVATISVVIRRRAAAQASLGLTAGLLFMGLLSRRRRRILVVSVLGLSLVACGPIQETSRQRSINVTAESESYKVSTIVQVTVE